MENNEFLIVNMFRDSPWPGNVLSNFYEAPFNIDGVNFSCSESFIQSLKCKEVNEQKKFCIFTGQQAFEKGSKLTDNVFLTGKIWWLGESYGLHSPEHFSLVKRGLLAKFTQSEVARHALIASGNSVLTHDYGQSKGKKQSLPVEVFCQIVTEIRSEIRGEENA